MKPSQTHPKASVLSRRDKIDNYIVLKNITCRTYINQNVFLVRKIVGPQLPETFIRHTYVIRREFGNRSATIKTAHVDSVRPKRANAPNDSGYYGRKLASYTIIFAFNRVGICKLFVFL